MKPAWLNKKVKLGACSPMKRFLRGLNVQTVCEQALCPNMGECFEHGEATFLILGRQCTRLCAFCNIKKGSPCELDPEEPSRVGEAVSKLSLRHVVITSVTRDDLADGGAAAFAQTIAHIRWRTPGVSIEVLIPDFSGAPASLMTVVDAKPDIIAHNIETVPSLYPAVRSGANYERSLGVLKTIKSMASGQRTKSGLMLGLGETQDEVTAVMQNLRTAGCDFLSIGQYLAPSSRHYPVKEFITPQQFAWYEKKAQEFGFIHVESGPYVRSSYHAGEYLKP